MKVNKLFIGAVIFLSACSSKIVKTDDLAQVHKVAIIGLDLQQQKSVSAGDLASIALRTNEKSQAVPAMRVESAHCEPVYSDLSRKIAAKTGWKVTSMNEVKRNPIYEKIFKEHTEGFQNRPMLNNRIVDFAPPGILDGFSAMTIKKDDLIALAKALKVDAVVYATVTVNLNNSSFIMSMVGNGEFKPSANTTLFVLQARSGEKIYMSSAEGPKVEVGEKNALGMANEDHINVLAQNASSLVFDLVVKDL